MNLDELLNPEQEQNSTGHQRMMDNLSNATWGVELECSGLHPGVEFPNQMAMVDWGESWTCLPDGWYDETCAEVCIYPGHSVKEAVDNYFKADNWHYETYDNRLDSHPLICGLNFHVRIPGLCDSLVYLKRILKYTCSHRNLVSDMFWGPGFNFPENPTDNEKKLLRSYKGLVRPLGEDIYHRTMATETIDDFFKSLYPHFTSRWAFNLRQVKKDRTLEFRPFVGSVDREVMMGAATLCERIIYNAFEENYHVTFADMTKDLAVPRAIWHTEEIERFYSTKKSDRTANKPTTFIEI